jgi:hypothetical protein
MGETMNSIEGNNSYFIKNNELDSSADPFGKST